MSGGDGERRVARTGDPAREAPPWETVEAILDALLLAPEITRDELIATRCAGDRDLADEVRSLLAAHREAGAFLESGLDALDLSFVTAARDAIAAHDEATVRADGDRPGDVIGRWRLLSELGRGGMGTVWLVERANERFAQQAALKLVRRGMDSDEVLARFRRERHILARLEHPNIARLLDGDLAADGRPFFVMERVDGLPITSYCAAVAATLERRLELFRVVCHAVQYAHRSLVVHSDLKPSNVMVTATGEVKLVDFGIATVLTAEGEEAATRLLQASGRALTPDYAAPEQVRGDVVTTATDVYQLGVLLFELLTGERPFAVRDQGRREVTRLICDTPPPRPSTNVGGLLAGRSRATRADLDAIVAMALRKEPELRYPSAEVLAAEVEAHLGGQPVRARGDRIGYLAGRFFRRHRLAVAGTVAALGLALGGFGLYTRQIQGERDRARLEADKALATSELLERFFQNWNPDAADQDRVSARQLLDAEARRLENGSEEPDAVRAATASLLGQLYVEVDDFDAADRLLSRAAELGARAAVPDGDRALTLTRQGLVATKRGQHSQAQQLYREAMATWATAEGNDEGDPRRLRPAIGLGSLLAQDRRYAEAAEFLERVVEPYRTKAVVPGAIVTARKVLAAVLMNAGRLEEARTIAETSLAGLDAAGIEGQDTLELTRFYGAILRDLGRLDEARVVYERLLERSRTLYGEHGTQTAAIEVTLGILAEREGDFPRAEQLLRRALQSWAKAWGGDHLHSSQVLQNLANVRLAQGDLVESEQLLRKVLEIQRAAYSGRNPDEGDHLNRLAYIAAETGSPDAQALYRQAVAFHEARPADEPLWITDGLHYLAYAMERHGDHAQAAEVYVRAAEVYARGLPAGHPYRRSVEAGLLRLGANDTRR